ncbi:MAG TPA: DNA-3-methyladenine glycosylase [Candidatus Acidoferrales bacterium]|nr:DNA-3-methyladenine glycosylase [Candidatus Acidoferrales bacterium]
MSKIKNYPPLPPKFFQRDTLELVPEILGKVLVRKIRGKMLSGRIVEIEAYIGNDPASHAANGMTERNKVMFEDGGLSYVYFTYGMHFCFNIVTGKKGFPAALLVRALEPLDGIEVMKKFRGTDVITNLTNGPAKLCQAMKIDRKLNGVKLDCKNFFIADDGFVVGKKDIECSTRIGIKVGTDKEWRFFLRGNEFVSKR